MPDDAFSSKFGPKNFLWASKVDLFFLFFDFLDFWGNFRVFFGDFFDGSQYRWGCCRIDPAFLSRIALEISNVRGA